MTTLALVLLGWTVLSVPVGVFVGRWLHRVSGELESLNPDDAANPELLLTTIGRTRA